MIMAELHSTHEGETVPFYPDHVRTEARVVVGIMVLVLIVAVAGMLAPVGVGDPADPMNTPLHVKPEWYFLALYQLLKFIPKTFGAVLPVIAVAILALWPFIDPKPDKSPRNWKIRMIVLAVGMIILISLTIWGEVS
jgi:quinol-cytochrome oxidoreductase complex cytochrome b subunit